MAEPDAEPVPPETIISVKRELAAAMYQKWLNPQTPSPSTNEMFTTQSAMAAITAASSATAANAAWLLQQHQQQHQPQQQPLPQHLQPPLLQQLVQHQPPQQQQPEQQQLEQQLLVRLAQAGALKSGMAAAGCSTTTSDSKDSGSEALTGWPAPLETRPSVTGDKQMRGSDTGGGMLRRSATGSREMRDSATDGPLMAVGLRLRASVEGSVDGAAEPGRPSSNDGASGAEQGAPSRLSGRPRRQKVGGDCGCAVQAAWVLPDLVACCTEVTAGWLWERRYALGKCLLIRIDTQLSNSSMW